VNLTVYTDSAALTTLQPEWNALLARSITNVIFLTWEWQTTWWEAYQAGELWVIAVRDDAGQLVGIAPWFIQNRDGARIVRTIGCVDVTDYVDVIAERTQVNAVFTALGDFLQTEAAKFDRINLCNIPETSLTYRDFPDVLRGRGFAADMILQEVCPVIHLPNDWDAYLAMLDKKQRHEIRRKIRRAESEAKLEYYTVTADHNWKAEVTQFFALMASSQPSKAEFLADERNAAFFHRILTIMFAQSWLRLTMLKVDGIATAAYCDFDYNGEIQVYNSGLLLDHCAHLSPGIVLLCYNIQQAIATGHRLFDFLRGNEAYKYRMGAQDTRVFKLVACRTGNGDPA